MRSFLKGPTLRVVLRPDYSSLSTVLAIDLGRPQRRGSPLERAMAPEWVITPSLGTRRWLTREMATKLGAGEGGTDGIVANWHQEFPGTVSHRVLARHLLEHFGLDTDPWALPQLQFHLYDWATKNSTHPATNPLRDANQSLQLSRARHFADLLDRYHVWRPEMVLGWLDDPTAPVDNDEELQRDLFLALRHDLAIPSPPERWAEAWASLRDHLEILPSRERLSVVGLTSFPGGARFLESLMNLDGLIDVNVYAVPGFADQMQSVPRHRSEFTTGLLQLWGGVAVANRPLLDGLRQTGELDEVATVLPTPNNLLASLQHTLRTDEVLAITTPDASVIEHQCHGAMRQAEVLRDAIRHDLAMNPDWSESDLLVVCPDLATFAPLIRTAFGPSRLGATSDPQPALAYRIVDPRLNAEGHYIESIRHLLTLLRSRFTRSELLQFLNQPSVRRRRRLDDESVALIATWTKDAAIRWGLNVSHRARFGMTEIGDLNTWHAGITRLQLGIMVDNPGFRNVDQVLPVEVPAAKIEVAANLSQLIQLLTTAAEASWATHNLEYWLGWFDALLTNVVAPGPDELNEDQRFRQALTPLRTAAQSTASHLSFTDFSDLVGESLDSLGYLGSLFTGGVTITSPDTLRWIPFKATYVIGFDGEAFTNPGWEHDDLRRRDQRAGDISPNDDGRSRIGELILATRERLTIIRTSRDLGTNVHVEPGVVCSELHDGIADITRTVDGATWFLDNITQHPRHGFHSSNFDPNADAFASLQRRGVITGPWSFSRLDVRLSPSSETMTTGDRLSTAGIASSPPTTVTLSDLEFFFKNPPRTFVQRTLGINLDAWEDRINDDVETSFEALTRATTIRRLVQHLTEQRGDFGQSLGALAASGDVPPLTLLPVDDIRGVVEALANHYHEATEGASRVTHRVSLKFDSLTVSGELHPFLNDEGLSLVEVLTSTVRLDRLIGPWIRAVALRSSAPASTPVSLTLIFPSATSDADDPAVSLRIGISAPPMMAHQTLSTGVEYYLRNLSQPFVYEPRWQPKNWLSAELSDDVWYQEGFSMKNPDKFLADPYWNLLFSDLTAAGLMERYDDPTLGFRRIYLTMRTLFTTVANVIDVEGRYGVKR